MNTINCSLLNVSVTRYLLSELNVDCVRAISRPVTVLDDGFSYPRPRFNPRPCGICGRKSVIGAKLSKW